MFKFAKLDLTQKDKMKHPLGVPQGSHSIPGVPSTHHTGPGELAGQPAKMFVAPYPPPPQLINSTPLYRLDLIYLF